MGIDIDMAALDHARQLAGEYLVRRSERPVSPAGTGVDASVESLRVALGELPEHGIDPVTVVDDLAAAVAPGLVSSGGGRYFGFVTGGTLPAAMAADWLVSTWDQNTALWVMSPGAISVQDVAGRWLLDVLDLPRDASVGFTTGAQMANWTCLASARHHVLAAAGWDVEADGLFGAPAVTVVVGEQRHSTIDRALRFLGFGTSASTVAPADDQGRMLAGPLAEAVAATDGPLIVCAQAGEVNTGAFDPFEPIVDAVHERGGWVHVDGAFGAWARASQSTKHLTVGMERADSWSTDGHKWLNAPYDCGVAMTAHPDAHAAAMTQLAPYLVAGSDARLDPMNWSPEASRRARAIATYAAMRSLGRSGIDQLVARHCQLARRFAERLGAVDGIEIVNEVVLNQVLVRFEGIDASTVIGRVQRDGTCWVGGTTFRGAPAMRISVSSWATTEDDVDRSVDAIVRCMASSGPTRAR
ncbi:MAG: aminotransferase class V-fold PLP-dependent enzyme [Ilumatobacteraceae bacterium]